MPKQRPNFGSGVKGPKGSDDLKNRPSKSLDGRVRSRADVKRLKMYRMKGVNNDDKKKEFYYTPHQQAQVAPDRRWFGNTRVIGQTELAKFREEMKKKVNDPYAFLIKEKKLPMALLSEQTKADKVSILDHEPFQKTFGVKAQRKRPKLAASSLSALVQQATGATSEYDPSKDSNLEPVEEIFRNISTEKLFEKGQSKRIWGELYKVLDSSDVVIQVLDARNPMGTRCHSVEKSLKSAQSRHKHLIFVLNKCDLVPTWVTARWIKVLSAEHPTIAFHASVTNPFGKGALIQLLRQFARLHADKPSISVGFIGYPNVGKSSVINSIRGKEVCKAAPIPGETKVWQYITLFRRVYLIDCPGVVYPSGDSSETDIVLKGVVRVANLRDPSVYVPGVLERVKPQYLQKAYNIDMWEDANDFLDKLARHNGRLLKGGNADINTAAKMVLEDFQRGLLAFYAEPPAAPVEVGDANKEFSVAQRLSEIRVGTEYLEDELAAGADERLDADGALPDSVMEKRAVRALEKDDMFVLLYFNPFYFSYSSLGETTKLTVLIMKKHQSSRPLHGMISKWMKIRMRAPDTNQINPHPSPSSSNPKREEL
jgi:nuclear GTP-binding protein